MDFNELSEELKAKAKECKSPEEVFALANEAGIELTEEQLDAVSGGWARDTCPNDTTPDISPDDICTVFI